MDEWCTALEVLRDHWTKTLSKKPVKRTVKGKGKAMESNSDFDIGDVPDSSALSFRTDDGGKDDEFLETLEVVYDLDLEFGTRGFVRIFFFFFFPPLHPFSFLTLLSLFFLSYHVCLAA